MRKLLRSMLLKLSSAFYFRNRMVDGVAKQLQTTFVEACERMQGIATYCAKQQLKSIVTLRREVDQFYTASFTKPIGLGTVVDFYQHDAVVCCYQAKRSKYFRVVSLLLFAEAKRSWLWNHRGFSTSWQHFVQLVRRNDGGNSTHRSDEAPRNDKALTTESSGIQIEAMRLIKTTRFWLQNLRGF